eukprot:5643977-Pyramimonas_sp.AAC.1
MPPKCRCKSSASSCGAIRGPPPPWGKPLRERENSTVPLAALQHELLGATQLGLRNAAINAHVDEVCIFFQHLAVVSIKSL